MPPLEVVDTFDRAAVLLDAERLGLLDALATPDSAAGIARRLGLARQGVNYHLRALEQAGLVQEVEQRRKGNCVERIVRRSATSYLISPAILGRLGPTGDASGDPSSPAGLIAAAARTITEAAMAD